MILMIRNSNLESNQRNFKVRWFIALHSIKSPVCSNSLFPATALKMLGFANKLRSCNLHVTYMPQPVQFEPNMTRIKITGGHKLIWPIILLKDDLQDKNNWNNSICETTSFKLEKVHLRSLVSEAGTFLWVVLFSWKACDPESLPRLLSRNICKLLERSLQLETDLL